jgi:hypothetical protein
MATALLSAGGGGMYVNIISAGFPSMAKITYSVRKRGTPGQGSISQRNRWWWCSYSVAGVRHHESCETRSRDDVAEIAGEGRVTLLAFYCCAATIPQNKQIRALNRTCIARVLCRRRSWSRLGAILSLSAGIGNTGATGRRGASLHEFPHIAAYREKLGLVHAAHDGADDRSQYGLGAGHAEVGGLLGNKAHFG